jgi:ketosteroid isomerase-like protein
MASFSDADAAAIRSQIDTYAKTALAADWDAWGQTLAPDVIALPPNSPPIIGRDAAIAYARTYPKLTRLVETVDEVVGEGNLAYARGRYSLAVMLADGSTVTDDGSFLRVHRRASDGSWPHIRWMWHSAAPIRGS